jgi:cell division initiation protein
MKITPLEIRQKTFEKAFRGLDKEEVEAYIMSLSQEWERVLDENKEYKIKLEASQKEVEKLREVESSLFRTLKTAEDTGANMIDQAEKAAELHLRESQIRAEAFLNEAETKAKDKMEEADIQSRHAVEEMEEQLKTLGQTYRMLENYRDDLLSNIKMFSQEALEKVERVNNQGKQFDLEEQIMKAKSISTTFKLRNSKMEPVQSSETEKEATISQEKNTDKADAAKDIGHQIDYQSSGNDKSQSSENKSFFDEID